MCSIAARLAVVLVFGVASVTGWAQEELPLPGDGIGQESPATPVRAAEGQAAPDESAPDETAPDETAPDETAPDEAAAPEPTDLLGILEARRDTLKQLVARLDAMLEVAGGGGFGRRGSLFQDWLLAWELRFEAEFELLDELAAQGKAPTVRARRLALYEEQVGGLRTLERKMAALTEAGVVPGSEYLIVKAARLKAMASLERARKKSK